MPLGRLDRSSFIIRTCKSPIPSALFRNTCVGFYSFFYLIVSYLWGLWFSAECCLPRQLLVLLRVVIYFAVKDSCLDSSWWMLAWLRLKWKSFKCQMAAHCLQNCESPEGRRDRMHKINTAIVCLPACTLVWIVWADSVELSYQRAQLNCKICNALGVRLMFI